MIRLGTSLGGELSAFPPIDEAGAAWRTFGWLVIWSTGAVYAAFVLVPMLGAERRTFGRSAAMLVAGAFSYWAGVQLSVDTTAIGSTVARVGLAGGVSALFIGLVASLAIRERLEGWRWLALAAAGAIGGAAIGFAVEYLDDSDGWTWVPGHVVWQVATCAALWFRRAPPCAEAGVRG